MDSRLKSQLLAEKRVFDILGLKYLTVRHEKNLYKVLQNRSGQYLNIFYYDLVLYDMYKKNRDSIIEIIRRVLSREITTLDMLSELGIYNKGNNEVFDEELDNIKKVLR